MNKSSIIGLSVAIILVAAMYIIISPKGASNTFDVSTEDGQKAIAAQLENGDPLECQFTLEENEGPQSWTMFFDGERFRGNYSAMINGEEVVGGMINDGEYSYVWGTYEGQTYGQKIAVEVTEDAGDGEIDTMTTEEWASALEEDVSATCKSWRVDNGQFTPPSDVNFTDLSALMNGYSDTQAACGYCDLAGDESAAAECRAALGCN